MVKYVAAEEQTSEHYLLGLILNKIYYNDNKKIAEIAKCLMTLDEPQKITVETASNIKCYNSLGKEGYQKEVRALNTSGIELLPSWKTLRHFGKSITPEIKPLSNGLGVEFDYKNAIEISIKRILSTLDEKIIPERDMTLEIKDGMDGSGSHSIFNQSGEFLLNC